MNKDKLSSWTLVIAVILIVGGLIEINNPEFEPELWRAVFWFVIGIVFAVITWRLRVAVGRERDEAEAAARRQQADTAAEYKRQLDEREERIRKERERFQTVRFPVAGVTFKNEDGTDRQKILREIYLNEDGRTRYEFTEDDQEQDPGIRVTTDIGCVGFIRRSDKKKVRRFYGQNVYTSWLEVEHFVNDEGDKIYRADVCLRMDREDPGEQWFFNDLPES